MMTKRGARGRGSFHYDAAADLWVGTVDYGVIAGRRRRRSVRAKDRAECLAKLRKLEAEPAPKPEDFAERQDAKPAGPRKAPASMTVAEWLESWLTNTAPLSLQPTTVEAYRKTARAHINPYLGPVRLGELTVEDIDAMMTRLERRGLSYDTRRLARSVLRRALRVAGKRYGLWPMDGAANPAAASEPPKRTGPRHRVDPLTAAEAAAVLSAAAVPVPLSPYPGDRLEALAVVVLSTGLRQSEALDLRWDDVDLERAQMTVRGTKSEASARVVPLTASITAVLERHRAAQRVERMAARIWADAGVVFATTIGTRVNNGNARKWWAELTERAGIGRRRFHASRHTAATLMLNAGAPLEDVSAILGHASLAITADVYAKPDLDRLRLAAEAMERVLGRK